MPSPEELLRKLQTRLALGEISEAVYRELVDGLALTLLGPASNLGGVTIGDCGMIQGTNISATVGLSQTGIGKDSSSTSVGGIVVTGGGVQLGDTGMIKDSTITSTTNIYNLSGDTSPKSEEAIHAYQQRYYEALVEHGPESVWKADGVLKEIAELYGLSSVQRNKLAQETSQLYLNDQNRAKYLFVLPDGNISKETLTLEYLLAKLAEWSSPERTPLLKVDGAEQTFSVFDIYEIVNHPQFRLRCGITGQAVRGSQIAVCRHCNLMVSSRYIDGQGVCEKCRQKAACAKQQQLMTMQLETDRETILRLVRVESRDWQKILGGRFIMGAGEVINSQEARYSVQLTKSFYVSKFLVSEQLFDEVMEERRSTSRPDFPKVNVSWAEAVLFCNRYSSRLGIKVPAYEATQASGNPTFKWYRDSFGVRLLTEAEWEFACRAGSNGDYPADGTGKSCAKDDLYSLAVYDENDLSALGTLKPNGFGLYDMLGLVREWVWDDKSALSGLEAADPVVETGSIIKVQRGGSIADDESGCRCATRYFANANLKSGIVGFRVAITAP